MKKAIVSFTHSRVWATRLSVACMERIPESQRDEYDWYMLLSHDTHHIARERMWEVAENSEIEFDWMYSGEADGIVDHYNMVFNLLEEYDRVIKIENDVVFSPHILSVVESLMDRFDGPVSPHSRHRSDDYMDDLYEATRDPTAWYILGIDSHHFDQVSDTWGEMVEHYRNNSRFTRGPIDAEIIASMQRTTGFYHPSVSRTSNIGIRGLNVDEEGYRQAAEHIFWSDISFERDEHVTPEDWRLVDPETLK